MEGLYIGWCRVAVAPCFSFAVISWAYFCLGCFFLLARVQDILLATSPTALRTLHFYNNMSGDLGAKALAQVRQ